MKWEEWKPLYMEIVDELGLSVERDVEAAKLLNNLIEGKSMTLEELGSRVKGRKVAVVFGAGPSLEDDLEEFADSGLAERSVSIAADGASAAFLRLGLIPHIVVTDLDGGDEALLESERRGAVLVVHAHGDNVEAVLRLVPRFGRILGTTQVKPFGALYNFGGFTDGDRAVFLAGALDFRVIILGGMGFGDNVGRYSKRLLDGRRLERKRRKLRIAKRLLEYFASLHISQTNLYNASRGGEEIKGFRRTRFHELSQVLS